MPFATGKEVARCANLTTQGGRREIPFLVDNISMFRATTIATGFHMSVPNGVAAIGVLGFDTNCGTLGRTIIIIIIITIIILLKSLA